MLYRRMPYKMKKVIEKIVEDREGGEFWSPTLRQLYSENYGIDVGQGSYGCFDEKRIQSGVTIGNYCSFAPSVYRYNGNHPSSHASTHPLFYNKVVKNPRAHDIKRTTLSVGHDVWIGHNVTIVAQCQSIGNGAIIGAGSIVTKNVEPYSIIAGNPAKLIKKRFSDDVIDALEKSKWWLLPPDQLIEIDDCVTDPKVFAQKALALRMACE